MSSSPRDEGRAPFDQQLARALSRPLARAGVHPNMLTTLTLALGVAAATCFTQGDVLFADLGALLFILGAFSDHLDGELARGSGKTSRFGYFYDFAVGGISHALLFWSIGIGLAVHHGAWPLWLGVGAALCNPVITILRLRMDQAYGLAATRHPEFRWFNLEDIIYAIGPLTWLLGVEYFFVPFALGTIGYLAWTVLEYRRWFATDDVSSR
jgi:phosphatidylglycerophosphate synthase